MKGAVIVSHVVTSIRRRPSPPPDLAPSTASFLRTPNEHREHSEPLFPPTFCVQLSLFGLSIKSPLP